MKVTPHNQTLILASERRAQGDKSSSTLDQALKTASTGGILKRVMIVAKQPDASLLYIRADYATGNDGKSANEGDSATAAASRDVAVPTLARSARPGSALVVAAAAFDARDGHGNLQTTSRTVGLSSYLSPAEQYAQTQRLSSRPKASAGVDVLA